MQYAVVFDAADCGFRYWWLSLFLIFPAAGGIWLLLDRRSLHGPLSRPRAAAPYVLLIVGGFVSIDLVLQPFLEYRSLTIRLNAGQYTVVEGVISDFHAMPSEGHGSERFVVSGHRYEYSDYVLAAGFNTTSRSGGPARNGLRVRIADVDGQIARLEVEDTGRRK
jgi:hypothetical protein